MENQTVDSITVMIEIARGHDVIGNGDISYIPELSETVQKSTEFFHDIAIRAMKYAAENNVPDIGVGYMEHICSYMFAKGIEAVFLWSDSPDGRIIIDFDPEDLSDLVVHTEQNGDREALIMTGLPLGQLLFQAHSDFMQEELTTPPSHDEQWVHLEMKKAIEWSILLGISHSLYKEYQAIM